VLKILLVVLLAMTAAFGAGGRLAYSGLQAQLFSGAGIKTLPDPSNIWSFHEAVVTTNGTVDVPVVVDFDNNGRMDSELKWARVYVTDVQGFTPGPAFISGMSIHDDSGPRWVIDVGTSGQVREHRFETPLVVPVDSKLFVRVQTSQPSVAVTINMIGRLVTL
jgi:hypothetical protein